MSDGIYTMQHNYSSQYLMIIKNDEKKVHNYETCNFKELFLTLKEKELFIEKSQICTMHEVSGALKKIDFDCSNLLLEMIQKQYSLGEQFKQSLTKYL